MRSDFAAFRWIITCLLAFVAFSTRESRAANVDSLGPGVFIFSGELRSGTAALIRPLPRGSTLRVVAWGGSAEAWEAAAAISDAAAERDLKVELVYTEDAAIGIGGVGGMVAGYGRRIAHTPINFADSRVQAAAAVLARFERACVGPVPQIAPSKNKRALVGLPWDRPETKGVRANPNQRWFFDSRKAKPPNWYWWYRDRDTLPGWVGVQREDAWKRAQKLIGMAKKRGAKMPSAVPTDDPGPAAHAPVAPSDQKAAPVEPTQAPSERDAAAPGGWGFMRRTAKPPPSMAVPGARTGPA